ncbi:MAG TPA: hypothetical protein PKX93_11125, partial [bacterium]|nr:hypothetical protein [bacterium]
ASVSVGVYFRPTTDRSKAILGYEGVKLALEENGYEDQVRYVNSLDEATSGKLKVLIIPCVYGFHEPEDRVRAWLRVFVEKGGGLLLMNEAIGWRRVWAKEPPFPEIGRGTGQGDSYLNSFAGGVGPMTIRYVSLKVAEPDHPVAAGIRGEIKVLFDMPDIITGEKGQVVFTRDDNRSAAVVAGSFGRGRVVLVAPNLGLGPRNVEEVVQGEALKLLLNCVQWARGN